MSNNDYEERSYKIRGLSEYQSGIVFLAVAALVFCVILYQIFTGRVLMKSGSMPLEPGLPWAWIALETYAVIVGIIRGLKMLQR